MLATVYPATSPQASQTVSLVDHLRDNLIPRADHGTSLAVHVGGVTATNIDFSHVLTDKLPVFIAVVVHPGVPAADGRVPQPAHPAGRPRS